MFWKNNKKKSGSSKKIAELTAEVEKLKAEAQKADTAKNNTTEAKE